MINWKQVAKWYRQQFLLWVKCYNEIADVYMVGESWSVGSSCYSITHLKIRAADGAILSAKSEVVDGTPRQ